MIDFRIEPEHTSTFVRTFVARPQETPDTGIYHTTQIVQGKHMDASYISRMLAVHLRWQWDENKQKWWGTANETIELVNPNTNERYKSEWKSHPFEMTYGQNSSDRPGYFDELLRMTRPKTKIIVTEVPE